MIVRAWALIGVLLTTAPAAAQTYSLEWWSAGAPLTSGSTVTATENSTATLQLYLRETGGTTLQTQGLAAFGVRGTYGTAGVISVATTSSPDIVPNAAFEENSGAATSSASFQFARATVTDVMATGDGRIYLGQVRFQTTTGTTTLTAADIPGSDDWFRGAASGFAQIDSQIQSSSITVSLQPVPEPSAVLAVGVVGLALWRRVRRTKS